MAEGKMQIYKIAPIVRFCLPDGDTAKAPGDLQLRKIDEALVTAVKDVIQHKQEIEQLLERYSAVEEYYKTQEDGLTAKINNFLSQQQTAMSRKTSAESALQQQRVELSQHERNLRSARERYDRAEEKKRERNAMKVGLGIFGVILLPVGGPILAAAAMGGAAAAGNAALEAESEKNRAEHEMNETKSKISNSECIISSLSNTITQLNGDTQRYEIERSNLQNEKGRLKEMIDFLLDAQRFGEEYKIAIENCSTQTELVKKLVDKVDKKDYRLFDCKGITIILSSFNKAWVSFREMREKQSEYVFKVEFDCPNCSRHYNEFPYVSHGQMVCTNCSIIEP